MNIHAIMYPFCIKISNNHTGENQKQDQDNSKHTDNGPSPTPPPPTLPLISPPPPTPPPHHLLLLHPLIPLVPLTCLPVSTLFMYCPASLLVVSEFSP